MASRRPIVLVGGQLKELPTGDTMPPSLLGASAVGANLLGLATPGAAAFLRINSDGSVSQRSAAEMQSDLGVYTGSLVSSVNGRTGAITLASSDVGLGNVTNGAQVLRTEMGVANGVATLEAGGKLPMSQIPDALIGQVKYQGSWNASTNSPTLSSPPAAATKGYYYVTSTSGTQFGISFEVGDWIISDGTAWQKVDNTDAVVSVAGRIGAVTLAQADVAGLTTTDSPMFQWVGLGVAPTRFVTIEGGSGTRPAPAGGNGILATAADGVAFTIDSTTWGSASSSFIGRRAGGTRSAPTATLAGSSIVGLSGYGHDGSDYVGPAMHVIVGAATDWSPSSRATMFRVQGTRNGQTAVENWLTLANGGLQLHRFGAGVLVTDSGGNVSPTTSLAVASLSATGGLVVRKTENIPLRSGLTVGARAKDQAVSGDVGFLTFTSDDAANQLQGQIVLRTDATAANRRLAFYCTEQGVAYRNITFAEVGGNVGIGLTTPTARLHVSGNGLITGTLVVNSGSSPAGSVRNITISTSSPSGGAVGDVWLQHTAGSGWVSASIFVKV